MQCLSLFTPIPHFTSSLSFLDAVNENCAQLRLFVKVYTYQALTENVSNKQIASDQMMEPNCAINNVHPSETFRPSRTSCHDMHHLDMSQAVNLCRTE